MFVAAAALVAELAETPFAVAGWPAPAPTHTPAPGGLVDLARARLARLLDRFHLQGIHWTASGPPALRSSRLHVTYWSPSWFAGSQLGEQTCHVGGSPSRTVAAQRRVMPCRVRMPPPWVLVTLGTSFNDDPNFFVAAAHAVDQMGCCALLVLGRSLTGEVLAPLRGRLPASARLLPHIDYARVLPSCGGGDSPRGRRNHPCPGAPRRPADRGAARRGPGAPGAGGAAHRRWPAPAGPVRHRAQPGDSVGSGLAGPVALPRACRSICRPSSMPWAECQPPPTYWPSRPHKAEAKRPINQASR